MLKSVRLTTALVAAAGLAAMTASAEAGSCVKKGAIGEAGNQQDAKLQVDEALLQAVQHDLLLHGDQRRGVLEHLYQVADKVLPHPFLLGQQQPRPAQGIKNIGLFPFPPDIEGRFGVMNRDHLPNV